MRYGLEFTCLTVARQKPGKKLKFRQSIARKQKISSYLIGGRDYECQGRLEMSVVGIACFIKRKVLSEKRLFHAGQKRLNNTTNCKLIQ